MQDRLQNTPRRLRSRSKTLVPRSGRPPKRYCDFSIGLRHRTRSDLGVGQGPGSDKFRTRSPDCPREDQQTTDRQSKGCRAGWRRVSTIARTCRIGRGRERSRVRFGSTAHAASRLTKKGVTMLYYALVFFIVAIIAAVLGFGGIAAGAAEIAKVLFFIFLVLFVVSLIVGLFRRGGGP